MGGYQVSVTVRGMLEQVAARVVRALRTQGFGVAHAGSAAPPGAGEPLDRYELVEEERSTAGGARAAMLVGETRGLVTVVVHGAEGVGDVLEADRTGRAAAALTPDARVRLRAALASLEGDP
jgi:hypothetical protein